MTGFPRSRGVRITSAPASKLSPCGSIAPAFFSNPSTAIIPPSLLPNPTSKKGASSTKNMPSYPGTSVSWNPGRFRATCRRGSPSSAFRRLLTLILLALCMRRSRWRSARRNYLQRVDFQIAALRYPGAPEKVYQTTWEKFHEEMLAGKQSGFQLHRSLPRIDSLLALRSLSNTVPRMAAVLSFVRRHMRWNMSGSGTPQVFATLGRPASGRRGIYI